MKSVALAFLALLTAPGCTSPDQAPQELSAVVPRPVATTAQRRTYWPLDYAVARHRVCPDETVIACKW